jgi:hypothetical protein
MAGDPSLSPFELAAAELRALRIALARLPGEYRVNIRNGTEATAQTVETLAEARGSPVSLDSPLEEARFELSVSPRWRTQLARRFTRYRRGMTTVDTSAADPEIGWHGPFGRVSLR